MTTHTATETFAANDAIRAESKFIPSRDLKLVAKDIRKDIACAVASGALPAIVCGVTIKRYSGGQSLTIEVREVPASLVVLSVKRLRADILDPHTFTPMPRHTERAREVLATLERIAAAYNRDRSDLMTDYHEVNFYAHVNFSYEIESAERKAAEQIIRAAYST